MIDVVEILQHWHAGHELSSNLVDGWGGVPRSGGVGVGVLFRSCTCSSMSVAPARTSAPNSWPLARRQRAWAASSSL
jgi:hypothetical protein